MSAFIDGSWPIYYAYGLLALVFDGMDCFNNDDSALLSAWSTAHHEVQVETRCPIRDVSCSRPGYTSSGIVAKIQYPSSPDLFCIL